MPNLKLLLLLIVPTIAAGQESITGKIINENNEPLPFASVRLNRSGTGTFTNEKGIFRLTWKNQSRYDTLIFSFIGYNEQRLAAHDLLKTDPVIHMQAANATLETVTVTSITALELVERAIRKIPDNYWPTPHITNGFYRVHTMKGDEHLMLSEAVFDVFNPGYSSRRANEFRLLQMRSVQDEKGSHGVELGLNPKALYRFDIIRELGHSDLLKKSGLKKHRFRFLQRTLWNGRPVHQVAFDQKDGIRESLFKGVLYIDVDAEAIVGLRLGRSPKGIDHARYGSLAERALLGMMGMNIDVYRDDLVVEYQLVGTKWLLARVQNDNTLRIASRYRKYDFVADVRVDYIVTGIDTSGGSSFTSKESLSTTRFIESQKQTNSKEFWKDYNILLADYNADDIAAIIEAKNENNRLKKQVLAQWKKLPKDPAARIDSIASMYHQNGFFNGSLLVSHKGQMLTEKGVGFSQLDGPLNTADTKFRIGSVSKTFTAVLLMQLVQEGKCRLSDTIGTYISGYVPGNVTLAQLLSHSSGIPSYSRSPESLSAMLKERYSLPALIEKVGGEPLEFEPGTAFRYSNTGYLLLAAAIEKITGMPWKQVLEERIFRPLQLNGTAFADSSINSRGYWLGAPELPYPLENMAGSAGISSTVKDLYKWAEALFNYRLLSKPVTDTLLTPRFAYTDWDAWYCYGWMKDKKAFGASEKYGIWYHPGTDLGYYSMLVTIPETQTVIVLLSNHGDFPRYDMTDLILKSLTE